MEQNEENKITMENATVIPVLPLRDVVVYPHMVIPLFVGREKSIRALEAAMDHDKRILLVAQKSAEVDDPQTTDIHEIGTLSTILQLLKLPDGTVKVLVEGAERASIVRFETTDNFFSAELAHRSDSGHRYWEENGYLLIRCSELLGIWRIIYQVGCRLTLD